MSRTLNIISNNVQGYGPSESTSLPCLGVSGRAVSVSTCPRNEYKIAQVKIMSSKCSLKHKSFICQANNGGYRRNPDFPRHNRSGYSRNRNRVNEEKDNSENLDESEFLSTKNGPLLSLSNSPKSQATATPGPREREIVELFKKVQAQLRQRAVVKEEKKLEAVKGQNKESETVDSLLKLLRKHSVEQGKRKVNGGGANDFNFDHPRQSGQSNEDKSKSFFSSSSIVREEPQETNKPSFTRPPSEFRRRSPVPRIKYEPIISHSDLDARTDEETLSELDPEAESDSDLEPDMDLESGLELEHDEEREEEAEVDLEAEAEAEFVERATVSKLSEAEVDLEAEAEFVERPTVSKLSEAELLDAEEDIIDEEDAEKEHPTVSKLSEAELLDAEEDIIDEEDAEKEHTEDLNAMKLTELRALAKSRGMKGFSKLKKSELVGLLSDDSM